MLPSPDPNVIFQRVSDGAVLLHTSDEVYFGLNGVGARVWELLPPISDSLDSLCSELARDYPDVAAGELRGDVEALLAELRRSGLVVSA